MTRLTRDLRSRITDRLLRHTFEARLRECFLEEVAAANRVYTLIYPATMRGLMDRLPASFFDTKHFVGVSWAGENGISHVSTRYSFNSMTPFRRGLDVFSDEEKESLLRAFKLGYRHASGVMMLVDATAKEHAFLRDLRARCRQLQEDMMEAERVLDGTLGGVTTLPALIRAWPEVEPLVRDLGPCPVKLPAIPVAALNERFALPVEE